MKEQSPYLCIVNPLSGVPTISEKYRKETRLTAGKESHDTKFNAVRTHICPEDKTHTAEKYTGGLAFRRKKGRLVRVFVGHKCPFGARLIYLLDIQEL